MARVQAGGERSGQDKLLLLLLSHFSRVRLCATPQTAAHQAPPSLGFSRQEYWSGVPLPSPQDRPGWAFWQGQCSPSNDLMALVPAGGHSPPAGLLDHPASVPSLGSYHCRPS